VTPKPAFLAFLARVRFRLGCALLLRFLPRLGLGIGLGLVVAGLIHVALVPLPAPVVQAFALGALGIGTGAWLWCRWPTADHAARLADRTLDSRELFLTALDLVRRPQRRSSAGEVVVITEADRTARSADARRIVREGRPASVGGRWLVSGAVVSVGLFLVLEPGAVPDDGAAPPPFPANRPEAQPSPQLTAGPLAEALRDLPATMAEPAGTPADGIQRGGEAAGNRSEAGSPAGSGVMAMAPADDARPDAAPDQRPAPGSGPQPLAVEAEDPRQAALASTGGNAAPGQGGEGASDVPDHAPAATEARLPVAPRPTGWHDIDRRSGGGTGLAGNEPLDAPRLAAQAAATDEPFAAAGRQSDENLRADLDPATRTFAARYLKRRESQQ
jgi:hypothetical protein